MTAENMTQRGNNAAAALDSVAANAYDVSKEILLAEDSKEKNFSLLIGKHRFSLDTLQAEVVGWVCPKKGHTETGNGGPAEAAVPCHSIFQYRA